jgi:hypothetical protein
MGNFWLIVALAAVAGVVATHLVKPRLWLVLPLALAPIPVAMWWVSTADQNSNEYDALGRAVWSLFLVAGWILGLLLTSVYVLAQRAGARSSRPPARSSSR